MKVLFFDAWTPGTKYFIDIDKILKLNSFETKLLHVESIIKNSLPENAKKVLSNKEKTIIDGIECIDVSFYDSSIKKALEIEKPDVVLMISISHFENRIVTRYCQLNNIPIIYFMHGVLYSNKEQLDNQISAQKNRNRFKILYKLKKLKKFFTLVKQYYYISKNIKESYSLLSELLKDPYNFVWNPKNHISLKVDRACVFSKNDVNTVANFFKVDKENIVITGNPRMDNAFSYKSLLKDKFNKFKDYYLYLDQSFVESGEISFSEQILMFNKISESLSKINKNLIIKLHPRGDKELYSSVTFNNNVFVIKDEYELYDLIYFSEMVLGHSSTGLIEALAMDKPIKCLSWFNDIRGENLFKHASVYKNEKAFFESLEFESSDIIYEDLKEANIFITEDATKNLMNIILVYKS